VRDAKDRAGVVDRVKNRSDKCEGPGRRARGDQWLFEKTSLKKKTENMNQTLLK
jgi:hypothetical protein